MLDRDFYDLASAQFVFPYTARVMNTRGFAVRSTASRQRGFSLVEVLISIIILSFGMLGMVGMQAAALQSNREARLQSVAYGLAQELAEMMRGNKDVAYKAEAGNPYRYSGSSPLPAGTPTYCLSVSGTQCPKVATAANQATVGHAQMTEWLARVDAELPGARVVVCQDTTPFEASGLPRWDCTDTGATAETTLPMYIKIGWTQGSTNRAAPASELLVRTSDANARPALVFPVIPGSTS